MKVQTAVKLSQDDQQTILSLKNEVEKSWKLVDSYYEKQTKADDRIQELEGEVDQLTNVIEQENENRMAAKVNFNEVAKERDSLAVMISKKEQQISELNSRCEDLVHDINSYQAQEKTLRSTNKDLEGRIDHLNADIQRELRRKERLNEEVHASKLEVEKRKIEERSLKHEIAKLNEEIVKSQNILNEENLVNEKLSRDCETLFHKIQTLNEELEAKENKAQEAVAENKALQNDIKRGTAESAKLETELKVYARKVDREKKRALFYLQQNEDVKKSVINLENQVKQMNKEILSYQKSEELMKKQIEDLKHENNVICKNVMKEIDKTSNAQTNVKIQERRNKNLENEIKTLNQENFDQRRQMNKMEKDREKFNVTANEAKEKFSKCAEEVKTKQTQVLNQQKKTLELEIKLKQQQQLYEQARSERNLYSKNLVEANDQIAEAKRKSRVLSHQIEQLKEEINAKDRALLKEHFDFKQIQKNENNLKLELSKTKSLTEENDSVIRAQNNEIVKLTNMIKNLDEDIVKHKKEYTVILNERDVLSAYLIRRNDEIILLKEKIKLLESTLKTGNYQYNERLSEIEVLNLKLKDIDRELSAKAQQNSNIKPLTSKIQTLRKKLREEELKVKALSNELENPVNIHRFRFLENSNPEMMELIQKVNALQKRLVLKNEVLMQKDVALEDQKVLIEQFQKLQGKQTKPEDLKMQLSYYQKCLLEKNSRLKSVIAEFNMQQQQINDYKAEQSRLVNEVRLLKKKLSQQMKSEPQGIEKLRDDRNEEIKVTNSS